MKTAITPSEVSAPSVLEELVARAERAGASDIHLQMIGKAARVSFRLDGVMTSAATIGEEVADRVFGRIKFLARLKTYQELLPQDGRIDRADIGTSTDLRVATYPTVTGEKIVLRLFDRSEARGLAELGMAAEVRQELQSFFRQSSGMLLLTGPAGGGKTTTIYSCLRYLTELGGRHIITIEDPVEQILEGVMQTEVSEPRGLTFAKAARHLLRQDPQVLVLGEIRDEETADIAVRASLTGHLMISTLHAGSCKGVVERLLSLCSDSFAVLSSLELILNQRLIRRFCPNCGGSRCSTCLETGFHGRVPIVEWIRLNETLRTEIRDKGATVVRPVWDLQAPGRKLVEDKITSSAEVERVLGT